MATLDIPTQSRARSPSEFERGTGTERGTGREGDRETGSGSLQAKQHFRMTFRFQRCENLPPNLAGDMFVKWERGRNKEAGRTIMVAPKGHLLQWPGSQTAVVFVTMKKSRTKSALEGELTYKTKQLTITLKQHKGGWGSSKDIGRAKLNLNDYINDDGTVHNIPLSTSLATSPILEVVVTSEPMSAEDAKRAKRTGAVQNGVQWADKDDANTASSVMTISTFEDDECNTMDTMSLADFSDLGDGSRSSAHSGDVTKKYKLLRQRAFQLRDALIKWQNHAQKLKLANRELTERLRKAESDKKTAVAALQKLNSQLNVEKGGHDKRQLELQKCQEEVKLKSEEIAKIEEEKQALALKLNEAGKTTEDVEMAQDYTRQVVEAYESQKTRMKECEEEMDSLTSKLREKDDELSHLKMEIKNYKENQSKVMRYIEKNPGMASLITSMAGLLVLVLVGMCFRWLSDW